MSGQELRSRSFSAAIAPILCSLILEFSLPCSSTFGGEAGRWPAAWSLWGTFEDKPSSLKPGRFFVAISADRCLQITQRWEGARARYVRSYQYWSQSDPFPVSFVAYASSDASLLTARSPDEGLVLLGAAPTKNEEFSGLGYVQSSSAVVPGGLGLHLEALFQGWDRETILGHVPEEGEGSKEMENSFGRLKVEWDGGGIRSILLTQRERDFVGQQFAGKRLQDDKSMGPKGLGLFSQRVSFMPPLTGSFQRNQMDTQLIIKPVDGEQVQVSRTYFSEGSTTAADEVDELIDRHLAQIANETAVVGDGVLEYVWHEGRIRKVAYQDAIDTAGSVSFRGSSSSSTIAIGSCLLLLAIGGCVWWRVSTKH